MKQRHRRAIAARTAHLQSLARAGYVKGAVCMSDAGPVELLGTPFIPRGNLDFSRVLCRPTAGGATWLSYTMFLVPMPVLESDVVAAYDRVQAVQYDRPEQHPVHPNLTLL